MSIWDMGVGFCVLVMSEILYVTLYIATKPGQSYLLFKTEK